MDSNQKTAVSAIRSSSATPVPATILKTENFVVEIDLNTQRSQSPDNQRSTGRLIQLKPILTANSSSLFQIRIHHSHDPTKILWQSKVIIVHG